MKATYKEGVLRLVPDSPEESEFLHDLYTQVLLTNPPTSIVDPLEVAHRNEITGGIAVARKSRAARVRG